MSTHWATISLPSCRYVHIDTLLAIFKPVEDYYTVSVFGSCYFYSNKSLHLPNKNTEIMWCEQEKQIKEK